MWIFALLLACNLLNITAMPALNHQTPHEVAFGETPDISAFVQHEFYDRVLFLDPTASFPGDCERAGRFLGVAESYGDAFTYHIWCEESQQLLVRSVVQPYKDVEDAEHPNPHAGATFDQHAMDEAEDPLSRGDIDNPSDSMTMIREIPTPSNAIPLSKEQPTMVPHRSCYHLQNILLSSILRNYSDTSSLSPTKEFINEGRW